jgi:hypothetical protein
MKASELNRDIKRLWKLAQIERDSDEVKKEFLRLQRADKTFEFMNKASILIMMSLNSSYRIVPFHVFPLYADENTLLKK